MSQLRVGSLFAGIGGFELGFEMTGHFKTVWQVESDEYARKVLERQWPSVPKHNDVRSFPTTELDCSCDVILGGFPCQDISYSGNGGGLDGERSGLFYELARIVRSLGPRYVVLENVPALLSRGMGDVLGELASLRYDAQWHCIPAAAVGAPHRRDRVFIIADSYGSRGKAELAGQTRWCSWDAEVFDDGGHGAGWTQERRAMDWWSTEPRLDRLVHGVPNRLDRLRCLGNAVVPQVARLVGEMLWSIHSGQEGP